MSTRATIKIEGVEFAKVYKHWDGYPGATLEWLKAFNKDFEEKRGTDSSYKFAQLLRSSARDVEKYDLDDSNYTGWGVIEYDAQCGEDYEYMLYNDGKVTYKSSFV